VDFSLLQSQRSNKQDEENVRNENIQEQQVVIKKEPSPATEVEVVERKTVAKQVSNVNI
jgi:hypothetical protein